MPQLAGGNVISGGEAVLDSGDGHILTIDGVPGDGVSEIQNVNDGDATAGDFKLRVSDPGGAVMGTTGVIIFNESAANLKILLDAIPGVTVSITGVGSIASPYIITFLAPGGNIPLMVVVDDTLITGSANVIANTAGVAGAYADIVSAGGLVKNNATGFVYENQGTRAVPAYVRIDTV